MFFDGADVPSSVRKGSLQCVENLSQCLDFSEYASLVVHPLIRCLDRHSDVRPQAMDTLASIVAQLGKGSCLVTVELKSHGSLLLGKKYVIFIPPVQKVLLRHKISHQRYDILCARVLEAGGAASDFDDTLNRLPRSRNR